MSKRVLVVGATGFIGRQVVAELRAAGHRTRLAVRNARRAQRMFPDCEVAALDLRAALTADAWRPQLDGMDAVVNCAGVLQASAGDTAAIHRDAPRALFEACLRWGPRRVVQVSALGADQEAGTAYASTKRESEDALLATDLDGVVLRPSLVYGAGSYGGTSLMRAMAALPLVPLIGDGRQLFQPVHIEDLALTIRHLVEGQGPARGRIVVTGPEPVAFRDILARLRGWLGLPPARFLEVPLALVRPVVRFGDQLGRGPVNSTSLAQLQHGNAAPPDPVLRDMGIAPRSMTEALTRAPAQVQDRWHARLYFVRPLLRLSLAALWLASGLVGFWALDQGAALFAAAGLSAGGGRAIGIIACIGDLLIAALLLARFRPALLALTQIGLTVGYTAMLTWLMPGLWFDPFGPLVKNLAIVGAVLAWAAIEDDR